MFQIIVTIVICYFVQDSTISISQSEFEVFWQTLNFWYISESVTSQTFMKTIPIPPMQNIADTYDYFTNVNFLILEWMDD